VIVRVAELDFPDGEPAPEQLTFDGRRFRRLEMFHHRVDGVENYCEMRECGPVAGGSSRS
jgi:hypothetical protein